MIRRLLNFWRTLPLRARWSAVGLLAFLWFIKWWWDGVQVIGPVPAPGPPKIVFVSEGREIKSMNLDGSGSILIARAPVSLLNSKQWAYFSDLVLQPDRQQIAVVLRWMGQKNSSSEIWSMNIGGDNLRNLANTRNRSESYPEYSADGTHISFLSSSPHITHGSGTYYSMNTKGRDIKVRESLNGDREIQQFLNPQGPWILSRTGTGHGPLYILHADGKQFNLPSEMSPENNGTQRKFTTNRIILSPDRAKFAFDDLAWNIYILNTDGSGLTNLTQAPFHQINFRPRFTPDSRQIVFISNRDGNNEIYIMNADGTNQRRLTNTSQDEEWFDVR